MGAKRAWAGYRLAHQLDYSPEELAESGLLMGFKRATIYKYIRAGKLHTELDEHGHGRITQAEVNRFNKKWREDHAIAAEAAEAQQHAAIRSHLNRAAALHRAATTPVEQLIAPLQRGRRARLAHTVDPKGELAPAELERRIALENQSQMEKLTAKRLQKELMVRQHGQHSA